MLDHIIDHLELAEAYIANADRIAAMRNKPGNWRQLQRRLVRAAARERSCAWEYAKRFGIDRLIVEQERAIWRHLREYSVTDIRQITIADIAWLRAVLSHSRRTSRNWRRAAELLSVAVPLLEQYQAAWERQCVVPDGCAIP
ncbi:MAG TPA: hypothetical protein VJU82_01485 [Acidobacteriaceae bacterium]|nr:hypothetical protein [Acidobacteriaceae bacterium]